jgi:hypothetical protein
MKKVILIIGLLTFSCSDDESCAEATARITAEYQIMLDRVDEGNATEVAKEKQRNELIKERDRKIQEACN